MKILLAHNYFQYRGGEGISMQAEARMLREQGHAVTEYTLDNALDLPTGAWKTALRTIWSQKTYRDIRAVLREGQYDLVQIYNFFPLLSPSICYAAKRSGVAVVQVLANYRWFCPPTTFFRQGRICEDCARTTFLWPCLRHRCYRDSFLGSLVCVAMLLFHRLLGTWSRKVDGYIAVSDFLRDKYVENGWDPAGIFVKYNTVYPDPGPGNGEGEFVTAVGRLAPGKGFQNLLSAWQSFKRQHPESPLRLKILGRGPLEEELRETARRSESEIDLLGQQDLEQTYELIGRSRALVFPSEWYEPFGRSIAEAFAKGTPVIASRIGGPGELIDEGRTGFYFAPGDRGELSDLFAKTLLDPAVLRDMRSAARRAYERFFSANKNYEQLMRIYRAAIERQ